MFCRTMARKALYKLNGKRISEADAFIFLA
jgi:hypothetical protein